MSDSAFRIYKVFAAVLCVCAILLGGFFGWLNRGMDETPSEHPLEPIVLPTQTTIPETTAPVEPPMPENLSPEEQLYRAYHQSSEYREGTYTLQDLDGNGVPEMLIRPDEDIYEVVTIVDGEPVSLLSGYGLFLCEGNIVGEYSEGSGGCTVWYYEISGSQAKPLVCIVWMFHEDAWYTSTDYTGNWDTMTPITEEEKNVIVSQYFPVEKDYSDQSYLHFLYHDIMQ